MCRRRAPMSSLVAFSSTDTSAIRSIAPCSNSSWTLSTLKSFVYWKTSEFSVSVKMRTKSSFVKLFSSTETGNLPCSSGIKSSTAATWNAPAAMNRMKSVFIGPYLVTTVLPSTMGRMSRCTPSLETSTPPRLPLPAILSISSIKMMPSFSARRIASAFTASSSTSFSASSARKISFASLTVSLRFFFFCGNISPKILPMAIVAPPVGTSISLGASITSTSTMVVSK